MFSEMARYCHERKEKEVSRKLSSLALKALLYEISLSPKPGLVDKFSNGSHTDMTFRTFLDSSAAISGWFEELSGTGLSFRESDYTKALPLIRAIGLRMETAMFEATGNINTQKGIIFLMGLSLFASGNLLGTGEEFTVEKFRAIIREICRNLVRKELETAQLTRMSHGEEIFRKYGSGGARGEAESGLRTVFEYGLPQLSGVSELNDRVMTRCFLAIAAHNKDTNIIYRKGIGVLTEFQVLCARALDNLTADSLNEVTKYCRKENISPGGSADLLAVSIFVWFVMDAVKRQTIPSLSRKHDF
jgi:holo-ACP synthase/triphosphoribosyl-dephospho-CoA synthase